MYIVEEGNIAVITCTNDLDIGGWQQLLQQVDKLDCPAVVDTRDSNVSLTELDAYVLAIGARKLASLAENRTAFVTDDGEGHTAFFARCSRHRGLRIRTFDNPATAADWALESSFSASA